MNKIITQIYSLNDSNNYKYELQHSSSSLLDIYLKLMISYIKEYCESKYTKRLYLINSNLYYHLLNKGVDTVSHIFKILLINTKNIELTDHYCRKAITMYIEFLNENNEHDDNKISYKHASLFSYGNTIYKLNKSYCKVSTNILDEHMLFLLYDIEQKEVNIYKIIDNIIALYKILLDINITDFNKKHQANKLLKRETSLFSDYILSNIETSMKYISSIIKNHQINDNMANSIANSIANNMANNMANSIANSIVQIEHNNYYKLAFIIDFLQITHITSIELIYILFTQVKEREPFILNKVILLQKILSEEKQLKEKDQFAYINMLLE